MKKIKISNLEDLEKLVLNPKVSKVDKYKVFKNALRAYPIIFIEVVTDDSEAMNGIEDKDKNLIPKILKIISEVRSNPTASHYSGMSVIRNDSREDAPADVIIDFRE